MIRGLATYLLDDIVIDERESIPSTSLLKTLKQLEVIREIVV